VCVCSWRKYMRVFDGGRRVDIRATHSGLLSWPSAWQPAQMETAVETTAICIRPRPMGGQWQATALPKATIDDIASAEEKMYAQTWVARMSWYYRGVWISPVRDTCFLTSIHARTRIGPRRTHFFFFFFFSSARVSSPGNTRDKAYWTQKRKGGPVPRWRWWCWTWLAVYAGPSFFSCTGKQKR